MSDSDLPTIHLKQSQLSDKDRDIVRSLEDWVAHTEFDDTNRCKIDLHRWNLLCSMDLVTKFPHPTFQIKRIPPLHPLLTIDPKGERPPNETEPDAMIVVRVINGSPTVTGQKNNKTRTMPLSVGHATWFTERVQVAPALDLLFMTSKAGHQAAA
ncbi:MAG: hypothetical protein Q9178_008067 [Gyalolechia marmorata]